MTKPTQGSTDNFGKAYRGRVFEAPNLLQIAMPMGGIGAGCICLNGNGGLQDFSIHNRPSTSAVPDGHGVDQAAFALLHIKGEAPITRLVEGQVPVEKVYDQGLQGQGFRKGGHEGFPRFKQNSFLARYPFGTVALSEGKVPVNVTITGWSPFIPGDDLNSSMPFAIIEYRLENGSAKAVDFEFSFHVSHPVVGAGGWKGTRTRKFEVADGAGGVAFTNTDSLGRDTFGSATLSVVGHDPRIKASWLRGDWFDALSAVWREVSTGSFTESSSWDRDIDGRNGASILIPARLEPGQSVTFPVVIAWHFPNVNTTHGAVQLAQVPGQESPHWRPYYVANFADATEVSRYAHAHYDSLRARTTCFTDALFGSTLPIPAIDAISSNLAILKSPTVLRQENGNVWAWEGCFTQSGCCHGTCTHVWNYAQAMPHLFPRLERTIREQELLRSLDARGHMTMRAALPDGPTPHDFHAASDGQLGCILKLYRDWRISGDDAWLERLFEQAQKSLDYCIKTWDPEQRGALFEPHHNTYDIEFWGPDGMCSSIYLGALAAFAEICRYLGKDAQAKRYADLATRGAAYLDTELFNGEYYEQKVMWNELRDRSFANSIAGEAEPHEEMKRLLQQQGPRYQYGKGCLSDGVIGAWMATLYGVDTPLDQDHVVRHLRSIFRFNFKEDLSEHACTQRPGYAIGAEPGLLLCTWPRGEQPVLPFVYSDEVWTGIEYQVASHLIAKGCVDEGLAIVAAARGRYDGLTRNPFNEYECGSYYARAMASFALLGTLSGFRYDAVTQRLTIAPQIEGLPFSVFFSTASAFGSLRLSANDLRIEVIEGELALQGVSVKVGDNSCNVDIEVIVTGDAPATIGLE